MFAAQKQGISPTFPHNLPLQTTLYHRTERIVKDGPFVKSFFVRGRRAGTPGQEIFDDRKGGFFTKQKVSVGRGFFAREKRGFTSHPAAELKISV
jgi:hypothetical protein